MRKLLLLLFLLGITSNCFAAAINVDSFLTPDDVTVAHLETMRSTFQGAINSSDGALTQAGTISTTKLDANANPENRWNEGFNDFIYTGLLPPTSASLASTTTQGTAYVEGVRVVKDATAHTYTASKHTFVDLSSTGTFTYSEVAINASEPTVASNSIRLARVSTDTTTVLAVRDDRVTTITLAAGSTGSIADTDGDTQIQTEESSDEDILRFDTGGVERMNIDDSGLLRFEGATVDNIETLLAFTDPTVSDKTITFPNETGTVVTSGSTIYKIGTLTVDTTNATASVAYTGVGFQPRFVIFFMGQHSVAGEMSIGLDDGTLVYSIADGNNITTDEWTQQTHSIYDIHSSGNIYSGTISAFGADGFTISWVKTGAPTGTLNVYYMAFK